MVTICIAIALYNQQMASLIRVVVADDEPAYQSALQRTLSLMPECELVGVAKDGVEAFDLCRSSSPDVLLTDINMPRMDGVELISKVLEALPETKCVVLTVNQEDEIIFDAFQAGALGYLLKTSTPQEVVDAIRYAFKGEAKITPKVASRLVADFRNPRREKASNVSANYALSDRESEILELIAKGLRNKEIADLLGIAEKTVKNHVSNILKALQVNSRTEAAMKAVRGRTQD